MGLKQKIERDRNKQLIEKTNLYIPDNLYPFANRISQ
jgi:hypothetical protein